MNKNLKKGEDVYKIEEEIKMLIKDEDERLEKFKKENGEIIIDLI